MAIQGHSWSSLSKLVKDNRPIIILALSLTVSKI